MQRMAWVWVAAVLVVAASGCAGRIGGLDLDEKADESWKPEAGSLPTEDELATRLQALTLEQRVAQLMLVTLRGSTSIVSRDQQLLRRFTPGGIIIPTVLRPTTAADYIAGLRALPIEVSTGIPMLIGTNLRTLPRATSYGQFDFFSQLPSLLSIAASNDPETTRRLATLTALQLRTMGFNMNVGPYLCLAPTLPEAKGTIQCLGSDPEFAADAAEALIRTFADNGIVPMPTGFPGGGLNRKEKQPAVLLTPRGRLADLDLAPFRRAIECGADILHVTTTLVPTIDPEGTPACLSKAVMHDLLRGELGFRGVIVAGPIDSRDILSVHRAHNAALAALKAGADMILWDQSGPHVAKAIHTIVKAVNEGDLSQAVVDEALLRQLRLKYKYNLAGREVPSAKKAKRFERDRSYSNEAYRVERRSITVAVNRGNLLPLTEEAQPIVVTGVAGVEALHDALEKHIDPVGMQEIATARHSKQLLDFEIERVTRHSDGVKTIVCILTNTIRKGGQVRLVRELKEKGARVVVVLLGYPSALPAFVEADAVVLSYCSPHALDESMRAVADVLAGEAPVGILPFVDDIATRVGEPEVFSVFDVIRVPAGTLPVTIKPPFVAGLAVPYDPRRALRTVEWDFGDGERSSDLQTEHAYEAPGRYPVTLTVVDQKKESTSRTFYVNVEQ